MADKNADKSQMIFETLKRNIMSFQALLSKEKEEETKQNILRSIILFSCSGIDAIVKQLILEALGSVIERDEGAQSKFRAYVNKKLKSDIEKLSLLTDIITAKNSRKMLIDMLKQELSFDSLQSVEQLIKVTEYFNIATRELISKEKEKKLQEAFHTRNIIVHQMDVMLDKTPIDYYTHTSDEVNQYYETIVAVSQDFIHIVNQKLQKEVTKDFLPSLFFNDGAIVINI